MERAQDNFLLAPLPPHVCGSEELGLAPKWKDGKRAHDKKVDRLLFVLFFCPIVTRLLGIL